MSVIVQNKIVSVIGFPWSWKSFLAAFLSYWYPKDRIFANFDVYIDGKRVNKRISSIDDLHLVQYADRKGILILDEMGINANSRRSMTDANLQFWEVAMLWRKKNVDIVNVAQLNGMADKYFRDMSVYRFEMTQWFERPWYLLFEATVYDRYNTVVSKPTFDLFQLEALTWITYSTLESSRIKK